MVVVDRHLEKKFDEFGSQFVLSMDSEIYRAQKNLGDFLNLVLTLLLIAYEIYKS